MTASVLNIVRGSFNASIRPAPRPASEATTPRAVPARRRGGFLAALLRALSTFVA
ncbi:MAG: hypothetical protein HYS12_19615 [Planctomycetes bacterium]|nr:hypothetical protein [Planctomycetota bacterium]